MDGSHRQQRPPRYTRRLSDRVALAFHQACDQSDVAVAKCLLEVLDFMMQRPPRVSEPGDRRAKENLVAAHERLWLIQNPTEQPDSR
jgi:hypothetical protein